MKMLNTTPERVHELVLTLRSIVEDELENAVRNEGMLYTSAERLQYMTFQRALGEAVRGLSSADYISHLTSEEITKTCEEAGVTVERAIINAMINNYADMAKHASDFDDDEEDEDEDE